MVRRAGVIGFFVTTLALASATAACRGPTFIVQEYPGPARASETIATLRVNGNDAAKLVALDEQDAAAPLDVDSRLHVEMLPGRHSVGIANAKATRPLAQTVDFVAEAGKFYRAAFDDTGSAHVYEIDRDSDAIRREVTSRAP